MGAREDALDVPVDVLGAQTSDRSVVGATEAVMMRVAERGWLQRTPLFF